MHIFCIHQHFILPKGCGCIRSYEFAQRWVKAGHKVTVVTGYADRSGLSPGKGLVRKQIVAGINLVIVGVKYSNKQSFFMRGISFLNFVFLSTYVGLRTRDIDVVYAVSTPLTVGIAAIVLKWLKGIAFVFAMLDQWPEIPIELGILKNKLLIKLLLWLEKTIYKNASAIIGLSPGMADGIREVTRKGRLQEKPIATIPNGCETDTFSRDINGSMVRKQYGWTDKFVLLHAGAMGVVNSLDFVIEAAIRLRDDPEILFVLVGEGSQREKLETRVKKLRLTNIEIRASMPQQQLPELYAAVDVGLVIIGNVPILEHNSASKFFDTLIAGRPVLLNYSGWQREVIETNNAGFGCRLYDLEEFIEKILYLNSHREQVLEMGRNARRIAIEKYDRQKLAMETLGVITSVKN